MKLSVSAFRAHASAHKKILSSYQQHYGTTSTGPQSSGINIIDNQERHAYVSRMLGVETDQDEVLKTNGGRKLSSATSREDDDDTSNNYSSDSKGQSPGQRARKMSSGSSSMSDIDTGKCINERKGHRWRNVQAVMAYYNALRKIKRTKSNQRWMKLRTTVQLSSAIQKKPPLKREDSFLKRFSTRQIPETQETVEDTSSEGPAGEHTHSGRRRRRVVRVPRTVVNPDENFYFYWLWVITVCVLYNMWTLIVRQSFPELQLMCHNFWLACDGISDAIFAFDIGVQLRTGYLEQGLMVYDSRKLAHHYLVSKSFVLDIMSLTPLDLLQFKIGTNPIIRFPRFLKVYRAVSCYYMVESRTVYPNFWRVINLIHILLILAHWFGCFYFLLSEAEGFQGDWVYPHRPGEYATLTRKYLGSLYWSTLTLTTIGDLPTPETNAEYVFTIVSYLIGVFIFATIVGQVGNVITNRNANRLEFERLLDGAKTYMRHHKVPGGMKRRVLRWYDYSWSRGRIQGGGDINTALGLLPDKLKTELALHVNLSVLKKVTIFQECQPEFLHDLVLKMKAYIFTPGDSICRKGEVAREMFIIADGILEVISEAGRVLTTMKAGDFFGEIGILNLDGLNKRTADVRSVGYSELFSLSREDVLAAMKDYPEAQEILQTLGRKRLQEARNHSRHRTKGEKSPDKGTDESTSKRIVHKIRSDVKGIRNAIKNRSRITRRSAGESIEMQSLSDTVGAKGVLRRMPRVESDDYSKTEEEKETALLEEDGVDKPRSPLGAGLPLLARLKLLKEKQDREEKSVAKQRFSTGSILPTLSKQQTTSRRSEPEVIGAGLPLLQRLLLLKAKEEREKQHQQPKSNIPSSVETISPNSLKSPLSPSFRSSNQIVKTGDSSVLNKILSPPNRTRKDSSGSSESISKPKVSFRDKILQVQSDGTAVSQPLQPADKEVIVELNKPETITIPSTVVSKIKSPAKITGTSFRDKLKMLQSHKDQTPSKPTENLIPETTIEKPLLKLQNPPAILLYQKNGVPNLVKEKICDRILESEEIIQTSGVSEQYAKDQPVIDEVSHLIESAKPTSPTHCDVVLSSPYTELSEKVFSPTDNVTPELSLLEPLIALNSKKDLDNVKKLIKNKSKSLDCKRSNEKLPKIALFRCKSEDNLTGNTCEHPFYKTSNESNETLERKKLKSILKKLSEDITPRTSPCKQDFKKLIRAPTLEGFAARHSKFSKSVTFHRHTLPSPPHSFIEGGFSNELTEESSPTSEASSNLNSRQQSEENTSETKSLKAPDELVESLYQIKNKTLVDFFPEQIKVPEEKPKFPYISAVANQRKLLRGSLEEQEYFGEVLIGIKQIIQGHLNDVQGKFHNRFINLELEVRKRDEIIEQLQNRIQELEKNGRTNETADQNLIKKLDNYNKQQTVSSPSEELTPRGEGFLREDSLDTVFARSPVSVDRESPQFEPQEEIQAIESRKYSQVSDEQFLEMAEKYDLENMSYAELKTLAENLLKRNSRKARTRLNLNLNKYDTYSRKKASKLKKKESLETDNDSFDNLDTSRIYYPSEEKSLLCSEQSNHRSKKRGMNSLGFIGSHFNATRNRIKKTLSVDAGMHQNEKCEKNLKRNQHRKFSLGSIFGYHKNGGFKSKQSLSNDVVLDISSDYSWSDNERSSSTSSDSDSIPKTPQFENFIDKVPSSRFGGSSCSSHSSDKGNSRGGDWEILMLAEELNKRELEEDQRQNQLKHETERQFDLLLKELDEESDTTTQREESTEEPSESVTSPSRISQYTLIDERPSTSRKTSSSTGSIRTERYRGLILRAASLDQPPSAVEPNKEEQSNLISSVERQKIL